MKAFIFFNNSTEKEVVINANTQSEAIEKLKKQVSDFFDYELIGAQG